MMMIKIIAMNNNDGGGLNLGFYVLLIAIVDQWRIKWLPNIIVPPDVDLRVALHPAQSLSVNVETRSGRLCHA